MWKISLVVGLLLSTSVANAGWVIIPADSPTSRIKTFVDDAEYVGSAISVKTQFAYGEDVLQQASLYSDLSFNCTKYTYMGKTGDSAILKRTKMSGQIRASNIMYTLLKDMPAARGKDNKKYSGITMVCGESLSEPSSISSENYYIALTKNKADFTFGDFWNRALMSIDVSDSTGKFEFYSEK